MNPDLVDIAEVAERLNVQRKTVHTWRFRGILPKEDYTLNAGPVWRWSRIKAWAEKTGRL